VSYLEGENEREIHMTLYSSTFASDHETGNADSICSSGCSSFGISFFHLSI